MNIYQQEISWERHQQPLVCLHLWRFSRPKWLKPWVTMCDLTADPAWNTLASRPPEVPSTWFILGCYQLYLLNLCLPAQTGKKEKKKNQPNRVTSVKKRFKILSQVDMRNPVAHIPSPRKNHDIYSIPDRSMDYIPRGFLCRVMESQQPLLIIHSDMPLSSLGRFISTLCLNMFCYGKTP